MKLSGILVNIVCRIWDAVFSSDRMTNISCSTLLNKCFIYCMLYKCLYCTLRFLVACLPVCKQHLTIICRIIPSSYCLKSSYILIISLILFFTRRFWIISTTISRSHIIGTTLSLVSAEGGVRWIHGIHNQW